MPVSFGLPLWPSGEESACQSGDAGSFPGPGRARMALSRRARQPQLPPVPEPGELQPLSPQAPTPAADTPESLCLATGEAAAV